MATGQSTTQPTLWGDDESSRRCLKCGLTKPSAEFSWRKRPDGSSYRAGSCKACERIVFLQWKKSNLDKLKAKFRRHHLKRFYRLTTADYEEMLARQGGLCAICRKPETKHSCDGTIALLHVDHGHTPGGKVRSLLCNACNIMLGMARDSPEVLRAAALYLEAHEQAAPQPD